MKNCIEVLPPCRARSFCVPCFRDGKPIAHVPEIIFGSLVYKNAAAGNACLHYACAAEGTSRRDTKSCRVS